MTKYIFGNWKMNLTIAQSADLVTQAACAKEHAGLEVAVFPTFTALPSVFAAAKGGAYAKIGAQDCFWEEKGAYTGEVSVAQLKELGCAYVLVGHSERRGYLGETDEMVNRKMRVVYKAGMVPILCIGESDAERRAGLWAMVIQRQVVEGMKDIAVTGTDRVFVAYEPIWAVGTGRACEPQSAREAHALIMNALVEMYGHEKAHEHFRIVYGGSVDASNIASYLAEEGIDGALVGGASQKNDSFNALLEAAAKAA
jgi:triosephosphate isomerase (TIM)